MSSPLPTSDVANRPPKKAVVRVLGMAVIAACLYGGWAVVANLGHGLDTALRAGAVQGASSAFTTMVITSGIEGLFFAVGAGLFRVVLATALPPTLSSSVHVGAHLLNGTPEVLRTIAPSVVLGYVFAGAYVAALSRSARRSPKVRVRSGPPSRLQQQEVDDVWTFFSRFVRRDRAAFEKKLATVQEVFLGTSDGRIVAFGAWDASVVDVDGHPHGVLMTHWGAIDPGVRGSNIIQNAGFRCFLRFRLRHPFMPVVWMFGASTFKSYLLMTRNFVEYWPTVSGVWPAPMRALRDGVMTLADDDGWDPDAGVVRRFGASRYHEGVVVDDESALQDPDIRAYHGLNPGQDDGDTLMCVAPLHWRNWWAAARAAGRRSMGRRR